MPHYVPNLDFKAYHCIPTCEYERRTYEEDLVSLGYNERKVKQFLGGDANAAKDLLAGRMPDDGVKNRKGKYQELRLGYREDGEGGGHENWIFFDPFTCPVDAVASQDLPIIIKLAFYEPGNPRYLEYNTQSKAIRMRTVGSELDGRYISYTLYGPMLEKETTSKADNDNGSEIADMLPTLERSEPRRAST